MNMSEFARRYDCIICYGAGEWSVRAKVLLQESGLTPYCYCVSHLGEQAGGSFLGQPLIEASDLPQVMVEQPDTGIIVAVARHQDEIQQTLKKVGVYDENVYYATEEDFPPDDVANPGDVIEYHLERWGYAANVVAQEKILIFEEKLQTILAEYGHIEIRLLPEPFGALLAQYIYYHNDSYYQSGGKPYLLLVSRKLTADAKPMPDNLTPLSFPNALLVAKMQGKGIESLLDDNLTFWRYCFAKHADCFKGDFREHGIHAVVPAFVKSQKEQPHKERYKFLTQEEMLRGEQEANALGLPSQQEFICFFARESQYFHKNSLTTHDTERYVQAMDKIRNSDVHDFDLMVDALAEHNVTSIRMGRESKGYLKKGAIDYPNAGRSDLLDFYLNCRCLFFIGTGSGASAISTLFAKPIVLTNLMCAWLFAENPIPFTTPDVDLVLYQKYYDKRKGRMLTLDEMLNCEEEIHAQDDTCISFTLPLWYCEHDIEPVKNSAEEIRDVALEMYQRLKGECVYDAEDLELRERYWEIIRSHGDKPDGILCANANVSRSFLKQNRWFLR